MRLNRSFTRGELEAIGARIRTHGDMPIRISHLALARLCITAEVPFGFGQRMLDNRSDGPMRKVDAAALYALLLQAEARLPGESKPNLHPFRPAPRAPWICADCGYGPGEGLKHPQERRA